MKKILAILLLIVFAIGCAQQQTAQPTTAPSAPISTEAPKVEPSGVPSGSVKSFDIEAERFYFKPNEIVVNKGDTVVLNVKSEDVTHGFSIPVYGINKTLEPDKTVTIKFVADKAGEFEFACSVVCGTGHGDMKGKLVVKE